MLTLNYRQCIGITGSVFLILFPLFPIIDLPLIGSLSIFELNKINTTSTISFTFIGYGIISCGIASVIFCLLNYCKALFYTCFLSVSAATYTLYSLCIAQKNLENNAITSFIMNVTETKIDENNLQWGWIVFSISILLLLTAAVVKVNPKEGIK